MQHTAILDIVACSNLYVIIFHESQRAARSPHHQPDERHQSADTAIVNHYALTDLWKRIAAMGVKHQTYLPQQ